MKTHLSPQAPAGAERRVAVVSGATGALGGAVCRRLVRGGWQVVMLGRDASRLERSLEALVAVGAARLLLDVQHADLSMPESVQRAVEAVQGRWPRIDLLVHAAGDGPVASVLDATEAQWQQTLQTKLLGTVRLTQGLARRMVEQGQGCVVIVNGTFCKEPHPLFVVNSAVNGALAGFAKSAALALGPRGVRVNVVNPGATLSPLWQQTCDELGRRLDLGADVVDRGMREKTPLGELASPDDVAEAVAFLASPAARLISGAALSVDGGATVAL